MRSPNDAMKDPNVFDVIDFIVNAPPGRFACVRAYNCDFHGSCALKIAQDIAPFLPIDRDDSSVMAPLDFEVCFTPGDNICEQCELIAEAHEVPPCPT